MDTRITQLDIEEVINNIDIDIIICASGYETRSSFLAKKMRNKKVKKKYVLSFNDQKKIRTRLRNDEIFSSLEYEFIENEKDQTSFIQVIHQAINEIKNKQVTILIDYSSMTRAWFASLINIFQSTNINIQMFFSYSVAEFQRPEMKLSPSIKFDPIPGFNNLSIPDRPTALIIGLGYEKDRAAGLIEYFDAEEVFLFHTDNKLYESYIYKANKNLIKQVAEDNIIPFPVDDIIYSYTILLNLCRDLSINYRIIIAPCGPKPFSILSYIVAIQLGNIDIWRISGINDPISENRIPSGKIIVFKLDKRQ